MNDDDIKTGLATPGNPPGAPDTRRIEAYIAAALSPRTRHEYRDGRLFSDNPLTGLL